MKTLGKINVLVVGIVMLLFGCQDGPKVISSSGGSDTPTGIFSDNGSQGSGIEGANEVVDDIHTVKVNEVIPAQKYVYANVTEGDETFWVATTKKDIEVGATYFYRGGLLKTNFESKEHNRTFDKIYLLNNFVKADHGASVTLKSEEEQDPGTAAVQEDDPNRDIVIEGSLRIGDLVRDADKYKGKFVQVSGECTKVNYNIMGRNWIHLKDGTEGDFDLVITSDAMVKEGEVVTMAGMVVLDKDFGAGYQYKLILEEGQLLN